MRSFGAASGYLRLRRSYSAMLQLALVAYVIYEIYTQIYGSESPAGESAPPAAAPAPVAAPVTPEAPPSVRTGVENSKIASARGATPSARTPLKTAVGAAPSSDKNNNSLRAAKAGTPRAGSTKASTPRSIVATAKLPSMRA